MAMQGKKLWFNTMKHTLLQLLLHNEEDVATLLINEDDNVHNECVKSFWPFFGTTCTYFCVLLKFAFMCYVFFLFFLSPCSLLF